MTTANTNIKAVNENASESKKKSGFLDKEASRKFRDTIRNYVDNYREYMTAVYNAVIPVDNSVINAWETLLEAFARTVKDRNLAKIEDPEKCKSASEVIKEYRKLSAQTNIATAISVFGTYCKSCGRPTQGKPSGDASRLSTISKRLRTRFDDLQFPSNVRRFGMGNSVPN